ncbi:FGGY-family carbohydrate kinase [Hoeflea ulvae]|uniref:FGGY-family carbohydrate kinase n=1 Tax=Hoeflea ulvae TaxID=2983764 RepID=A0ABT3YDZ2_9HYPH|nr:FGGY-family carbohydrate kinase [Hoeflea ulvae]MCY0094032.1 FGGY-family carbohydrate kinase [Hoeflea ulvae]
MRSRGNIAVIDIGKTNAKVVLVGGDDLHEIDMRTMPNVVIDGAPYPHYDVEALWAFIEAGLAQFHAAHGIAAISITAHGASGALLDQTGSLAAPILDYEHTGPDQLAAEYDARRPAFAEIGSPRLPRGLNLGAQLYWQFSTFAGLFDRTCRIVTYPQYWAFRLTGVAATEVTSLGAHTDLWNPHQARFSSMVDALGWREKFAPVRRAGDVLGKIRPEIAARTGLAAGTPVCCGIHDSNASLLPYILANDAPFSVISTGTWVIVMTVNGKQLTLDPMRDTLINVSANGNKVPSARFMGGREFERLMQGRETDYSEADIDAVLEKSAMLWPSIEPTSGPFPGRTPRWSCDPETLSDGERAVVASFYLAVMTNVCLQLTGSRGQLFVEGAMASNAAYKKMLSAVTGQDIVSATGTGTSTGAAMLVAPASRPPLQNPPDRFAEAGRDPLMAYAQGWAAGLI